MCSHCRPDDPCKPEIKGETTISISELLKDADVITIKKAKKPA
jgi:hypothetical protein